MDIPMTPPVTSSLFVSAFGKGARMHTDSLEFSLSHQL